MTKKHFEEVYNLSPEGQKKLDGIMDFLTEVYEIKNPDNIRFLIRELIRSERMDAALKYHDHVIKYTRN